jgi:diguanylate cyclase (GGDEF)-like protein
MDIPLTIFPDAYLILDHQDQVVAINPAGVKLLQLEKAEILGKSLAEVCSGQSFLITPDSHDGAFSDANDGVLGSAKYNLSSLQSLDGKQLGKLLVMRTQQSSGQHQELQDQNEILLALQETTFDLHSSLDLKVVLHNIVARACKLLGTEHGFLAILRESGEMEAVVGFGALAEALEFKVKQGDGVTGIVWKTGRPLFIPNYDQWSGRSSFFPYNVIRAILGMPLLFNGEVIGVIDVARSVDSDVSFTEEEIAVLGRFVDLAVLALQNARLFQQAQAEIAFRRKTEMELRNANQILQFQIERVELLQGQLHELAVRDTLTNLFNRRYLQEMLEVEFARARRSSATLAILMLDCDSLKDINDTYGHKAGDDSLVRIANVIRESIRAGDIACRYGGDEFVVVLNNVSEKTAFERAESLRNRIATEPIQYKEEKIDICVSIGVAMFPVHGAQTELLLQRADRALYAAKREGKNKVMVFNDRLD